MPLIFQDRILSDDLHAHPDRLFLFGDNELRRGRGGQAAACRGHTNAVGVATKRAPDRQDSAYWTDADYDRITAIIDHDLAAAFDHIRLGGTVVCPSAGLGTGRAELPSRAPRSLRLSPPVHNPIKAARRHRCLRTAYPARAQQT